MGEAKRRGTQQERVAKAIVLKRAKEREDHEKFKSRKITKGSLLLASLLSMNSTIAGDL